MTRSITIPDTDGMYPGILDTDYHADTTSLSSSGARKILSSPARFKYDRDNPPASTQALDFGSAYHTDILGVGGGYVRIEAGSRAAKAYKDAEPGLRAVGAVPLLAAEVDLLSDMRKVMRQHWTWPIIDAAECELSGYHTDASTGVRLRFRVDALTELDGRPLAIDLKTTRDANPLDFNRTVAKYGYHQQAAWYLDGLAACGIQDARFWFIAQEKYPPHLISVVELDDAAIEEGRKLNRQAIDLYARCTETGEWPGYPDTVIPISLPMWAYSDDEELEIVI